ncbi:hypothetical protein L914_17717 [Phytophthora nicotianae]|uniref:Uncharacterized protein n=1 Tax=Phytophthora nicotianae TaxID=4792 RepID=W2MI57_PHYNI|nr:hypothetical protein L914_17717 [Phytophthora nicotianae]
MTLAEAGTATAAANGFAASRNGGKLNPRGKRKSTGTRRKEEMEKLGKEVEKLQAKVDTFQKNEEAKLEQNLRESNYIRQAVLQQQASLVNVQSALSRLTTTQPGAPHATSIRLGSDFEVRWKTLKEMKPIKLRAAQHYLKERGRFVNDTSVFSFATRFIDRDGCSCGQIYDVVPFEGVSSVKLVFDALQHYFSNMEIRVTENLGDITIREDDGSSEPGISQCRFVSHLTNGPVLEMNTIICSEFKEADDEFGDGGPVGIFTEDFVDQDDLYPYFPEERIRQDATVVTQVRCHVKKIRNDKGAEEERPIVVMHRWAHCRTHKTKFPLSTEILRELREKSTRWSDAKLDAVREFVYHSK